MSLFVTSLNSGSNGNCYYVGNEEDAILVDVGISCRETEKRMKQLGLSIKKIRAIFISHEHSDHISGVPVLSRKYQIPVYITAATLSQSGMTLETHLVCTFRSGEPVRIGELSVAAFAKYHDAVDPHSFLVRFNQVTVGIFTDIGIACKEVIGHFRQCHAAFLESNYDEELLEKGTYPAHLKKRIRNGHGHLSNKQALQLLLDHKPAFMSHLFLSHLSHNNNNPDLVLGLFLPCSGSTKTIIASRHEATALYEIVAANPTFMDERNKQPVQKPRQLSMF